MGTVDRIVDLLESGGVRLTLVDVGASLEPFEPFRPLLRHATYVGFDPDRREVHDVQVGSGRAAIVDKAVVADGKQDKARFFLTRNPTCSSTLEPLPEAVAPYLHADRFDVVDTAEVAATTLDRALESVGVEQVDWLKLDTQGTDLRLLRSLDARLWAGLMAVDAEPGFDPYYEGEDTFGELHRELVGRGFWMADLELTTAVRLRRQVFDQSLRARSKLGRLAYEFTLKPSPIAAGPRYLRTIESLRATAASRHDYLRLWACAWFSGNHPYALDVAVACEEAHGADETTSALQRLARRRNRAEALRSSWRLSRKLSWRNLRRLVTKPY
jgi:FkbM family methyltransferase